MVQTDDPRLIRSDPDESLASHLMVFRAEEARLSGAVAWLRGGPQVGG